MGQSSNREGSAHPAEQATRERAHLAAWSPCRPTSEPIAPGTCRGVPAVLGAVTTLTDPVGTGCGEQVETAVRESHTREQR